MWKRFTAFALVLLCTAAVLLPSISSAEGEEKFTLDLELYDTAAFPQNATPLPDGTEKIADPLKLSANQSVTVAIHYSGLDAMKRGGIQCLQVSFDYDADCFELIGFEDLTSDTAAVTWGTAASESSRWIAQALKQGYTASASVRKLPAEPVEGAEEPEEGRDVRRITIQYIAEASRGTDDILSANAGYFGAVTFQVRKAFAASEGVKFAWHEYAFGLYERGSEDTASIYRAADLREDASFDVPVDVPVATAEAPVTPPPGGGVTVSGDIYSYNHYNSVVIKLFSMDDLEGEAKYSLEIAGEDIPATMAQRVTTRVDTHFEIEHVTKGVYQLRVMKAGHMDTVINNLEVTDEDYDLDMTDANIGKPFVWAGKEKCVNLICGQLDTDASLINAGDLSEVINSMNWGKTDPDNPAADLDGNGEVRAGDLAIVINSMSWMKKASICEFDLSE